MMPFAVVGIVGVLGLTMYMNNQKHNNVVEVWYPLAVQCICVTCVSADSSKLFSHVAAHVVEFECEFHTIYVLCTCDMQEPPSKQSS